MTTKCKTRICTTAEDMDEFINNMQEHKGAFATQTHIGFTVDGTPRSFTAVVFYRED